ncbi:MAG: hypothetical protein FK733_17285 [Asgard group archaeon]|nr:hypothetical protein [Asgard group archaeon]
MKYKKVIVIISIIVILIGGSTGVLVYFLIQHNSQNLPQCIAQPFTAYPTNINKITHIVPLGNLNPPDHTFPTDHMYFITNTTLYPEGLEIFAPGNITISTLSLITYDPPSGNVSTDYSIDFDVCQINSQQKIGGRFGHLDNLSDYLWNLIDPFGEEFGDGVYTWEVAGRTYTSYNKQTNLKVDVGKLIAFACQMGGFDFWLKDESVYYEFVNTEWTEEFQHTVSPIAYFREDLQVVLKDKLQDYWYNPVDPLGYEGRVDFDIHNTAQGLWVRADYTGRAEENGLALVYFNFNASQPVFSIGFAGNSSWDSNVYKYRPKDSGFQDRLFANVTNDDNVYSYIIADIWGTNYDKAILMKMTSERELLFMFIDPGGLPLPPDLSSLFDEEQAIRYIR